MTPSDFPPQPSARKETIVPASAGRRLNGIALLVFVVAAVYLAAGVAGPGLAWDEPAYRLSQIYLQNWFNALFEARSLSQLRQITSAESIDRYWEYNRFGPNFHPPMGGYLNLLTWGALHPICDDLSARRMASALELAAAAAILFRFLASRYGIAVGLFAAGCLCGQPRVVAHAHLIDTDMPLLLFWTFAAVSFYLGLRSRPWQWIFATAWGAAFLVKFSAVALVIPCAIGWLAFVTRYGSLRSALYWLKWSLFVFTPPLMLAFVLLGSVLPQQSWLADLSRFGLSHAAVLSPLFAWPLLILGVYAWRGRRNDPAAIAGELPWIVAAWTPLVCLAANPTWWHGPVERLHAYFALSLGRAERLPDIGIFYWGQKYLYSLPWHSGPVLTALVTPWGILLLSVVGVFWGVWRCRRDALPAYFAMQAATLPLLRLLPSTPAHDGVRLFLPSFFFLAGLAAIGAMGVAKYVPERRRRWAWTALWLIGPVWGVFDTLRIHPYELSYYNIGLGRAVDAGFEPTYWYDAVTPGVIEDLNRKLPENVTVLFPDPLINPETFVILKQLGRLRGDVNLDGANPHPFPPWMWLLTHPAKATAFTKLLYAMPPWYAHQVDGVRLFSVVDDRSVATALALHLLTVRQDRSAKAGATELHEWAWNTPAEVLRPAATLLARHRDAALAHARDPAVADALRRWLGEGLHPTYRQAIESHPESVLRAVDILITRPDDLRRVLQSAGYLRDEQFGGPLWNPEPNAAESSP